MKTNKSDDPNVSLPPSSQRGKPLKKKSFSELSSDCQVLKGELAALLGLAKLNQEQVMSKFAAVLQAIMNDESGQDLIEYALVAGLIGLGAVAAMGTLATNISNAFGAVGTTLSNAT